MRNLLRWALVIFVFLLALWQVNSAVGAPAARSLPEITLQVGDSHIIECAGATRSAVGDPVVADIAPLSSREILVNGKSPGKTVVYVWDSSGRRAFKVTVQPTQIDMDSLVTAISREINDQRVSVRGIGNTVILEGAVTREAESSRAASIAQAVCEMSIFQGATAGDKAQELKTVSRPDGDSFLIERVAVDKDASVAAKVGLRCPKVVNLIQLEKPIDEVSVRTLETAAAIRQALNSSAITVRALPGSVVLLEGKVGTKAEIERIDLLLKGWVKEGKDSRGAPDGTNMIEENITIVNSVVIDTSVAQQIMVRAQIVDIDKNALKEFGVDWGRVVFGTNNVPGAPPAANVVDQPWLIGQTGFGPFDIFGGGSIDRFDPIGARVRALEQQNKAKVLSQPNLLVLDGREASMLVGGEVPIPVLQSGTTGVASGVTIEYKEFGVRLRILPVITDANTIQLSVMPEVSSLDFANAIVISGFTIPALRTRRAETTVNIRDGQSLLIGGLIQNETSKIVKKIPVLGDLPILGELFKTRRFANDETELVIIITPQIVNPTATAQAAPAPAPGQ